MCLPHLNLKMVSFARLTFPANVRKAKFTKYHTKFKITNVQLKNCQTKLVKELMINLLMSQSQGISFIICCYTVWNTQAQSVAPQFVSAIQSLQFWILAHVYNQVTVCFFFGKKYNGQSSRMILMYYTLYWPIMNILSLSFHTHTYTHTYTHTHTHTHTHTQTHTQKHAHYMLTWYTCTHTHTHAHT